MTKARRIRRATGLEASAVEEAVLGVPLESPFSWRMNLHGAAADRHAEAWVERWGLFPEARARHRFLGMEIPRLGAMAYPDCGAEALAIATDWCTWLFAWDDRCDRTPLGGDPEALRREQAVFLRILAGSEPDAGGALASALADLRERMLAHAGRAWLGRFEARVAEYFASCEWEASNRARGVVPELASYVTLRTASGAVLTAFELFELTDGDVLPEQVREDERVRRLERAANDVICWSNDILSLDRELAAGDVHNLVIVLLEHEEPSLHHALARAARMHDDQVRRYQELEHELRGDASIAPAIERRCSLMRAWMAANQQWSRTTRRYRATKRDEQS